MRGASQALLAVAGSILHCRSLKAWFNESSSDLQVFSSGKRTTQSQRSYRWGVGEAVTNYYGVVPIVGNAPHRLGTPSTTRSGIKKSYYITKTIDIFVPRFALHWEYRTMILENVTYTMYKMSLSVQNQVQSQELNMKSPYPHNLLYNNTWLHITNIDTHSRQGSHCIPKHVRKWLVLVPTTWHGI